MEMDELKLDYKLHEVRVCPMGRVRSSCNGMLLLNHPKRECVLQVVNVVTRCYQTLPKCHSGCPHKECGYALTFDPFTQVY
ncbi:Potassium channel subfamily U member 1 like [Actinidia chinensis var. chinensis]|uniref:Potassium channel subfamily U member 1 like n=1 Tax=Actinidia chinensis var. chinensis TaxID=1590841 RepID=A0A2R6RX89_ACTCC|nr:Potassium channel subfamily U member 1 like [Actinidia chinensis var. chinensis]